MLSQIRQQIAVFIYPEMVDERRTLERFANVDPLTGLANRRAFDLARPAADLDPLTAVVIFDANDFGKVNKQFGQTSGDAALRVLADSLRDAADAFGFGERVFRIGGDEFVALIPKANAEAIRDAAETLRIDYPGGLTVTVSGTIGDNLAEAENQLQGRKAARKGNAK